LIRSTVVRSAGCHVYMQVTSVMTCNHFRLFSKVIRHVSSFQFISEHFRENHVSLWLTVAKLWCFKLCALQSYVVK